MRWAQRSVSGGHVPLTLLLRGAGRSHCPDASCVLRTHRGSEGADRSGSEEGPAGQGLPPAPSLPPSLTHSPFPSLPPSLPPPSSLPPSLSASLSPNLQRASLPQTLPSSLPSGWRGGRLKREERGTLEQRCETPCIRDPTSHIYGQIRTNTRGIGINEP
jgi:hypothetical protein